MRNNGEHQPRALGFADVERAQIWGATPGNWVGKGIEWWSYTPYASYMLAQLCNPCFAALNAERDRVASPSFTRPYDDAFAAGNLNQAVANAQAVWSDAGGAYILQDEMRRYWYWSTKWKQAGDTLMDIGIEIMRKAQMGVDDARAEAAGIATAQQKARAAGVALRRAIEKARAEEQKKRQKRGSQTMSLQGTEAGTTSTAWALGAFAALMGFVWYASRASPIAYKKNRRRRRRRARR